MLDLYLCFDDRTEAVSALQAIGIDDGEGGFPVDGTSGGIAFALDLVFGNGTLSGQVSGDAAPLPGCHVNLRWRDTEPPLALAPYRLEPATPAVRWA